MLWEECARLSSPCMQSSCNSTSSFTGDLTEIERDYQQGRHINDLFTYWVVYSLPVQTKTAIFNYIHAP